MLTEEILTNLHNESYNFRHQLSWQSLDNCCATMTCEFEQFQILLQPSTAHCRTRLTLNKTFDTHRLQLPSSEWLCKSLTVILPSRGLNPFHQLFFQYMYITENCISSIIWKLFLFWGMLFEFFLLWSPLPHAVFIYMYLKKLLLCSSVPSFTAISTTFIKCSTVFLSSHLNETVLNLGMPITHVHAWYVKIKQGFLEKSENMVYLSRCRVTWVTALFWVFEKIVKGRLVDSEKFSKGKLITSCDVRHELITWCQNPGSSP